MIETESETIVPSLTVVPLLGMNPDGSCGPFLGSASFVGEQKILVTCNHVVESWGHRFGFTAHEDDPQYYEAELIQRDPETDLAFLKTLNYEPPYCFSMPEDDQIQQNDIVLGFEYGTTETVGHHIKLSPASRMGNVTRMLDMTDRFGTAGDMMLELSFPALKGASGAPIITWRPPFKLLGVISQNVARELHPAQVEQIHDDSGKVTEETRFYLPQALAIHFKHVRAVLESIG